MGQKEQDHNAGATSAKVVPLWPASIRDDPRVVEAYLGRDED